ncbi:hypothetical protein N0V82_008173 [Gnomoniopsis sp. IMI 355080]|nr:hypothetical protein N0V82_008173 [Gnomoniopsis sp. IMI 355080]
MGDAQPNDDITRRSDIAKASDWPFIFPINYRYDYLDGLEGIFSQLAASRTLQAPKTGPQGPRANGAPNTTGTLLSENAIELCPSSAGFPHRTSFGRPKQNKHWRNSLAVGLDSIKLFAQDDTFPGKTLKNGTTLSQVASKMYHKAADDFLRHFIYMLPHADEERAALIEVVCAWVPALQQAFLAHLMGTHGGQGTPITALQKAMHDTVQSLRRLGDTGGEEVLQATIDFITLPRPEKSHFDNLEEFLEWRREDAAVRFTLACVKFSLNSKVDILHPRLAKLYQLFSDHIVYVNDLASYEKEKVAYHRGEAKMFANIVEMIRKFLSLPADGQRAKALAYGLQLQVESDIYGEMARLQNDLQDEEWRVVYGWLDESSGHCFVSHMLRRYGGEVCRMPEPICR